MYVLIYFEIKLIFDYKNEVWHDLAWLSLVFESLYSIISIFSLINWSAFTHIVLLCIKHSADWRFSIYLYTIYFFLKHIWVTDLFIIFLSLYSSPTSPYSFLKLFILCTSFPTIHACLHMFISLSLYIVYISFCKWNSCISFSILFLLLCLDSVYIWFALLHFFSSGRFRLSKVRQVLSNFFRTFFLFDF